MSDFKAEFDSSPIRHGVNFYNSDTKYLHVICKGQEPLVLRQKPIVLLSMGFVSEDINDFFNEEDLLYNVANLLGISPGQIRIVKVRHNDI